MPGLVLTGDDYAVNPGLSVNTLAAFLRDIDFQPAWRARAEIDAEYYDSNQYDSKTLGLMNERGIPPIVVNLIAPTINLILGMEAKVRQDWVVRADDEQDVDFALAMSKELQVAERGCNSDRACSEAYAAQVKSGLGWVHTYRQKQNPLAFPYVSEYVHRREIWWDWYDSDPMLRNARWLVRRKWYDADVLRAMWPDFTDLIDQVVAGWNLFEDRNVLDMAHPLYQDWLSQRDFHWQIDQWRNLDRKRLALYEVWYRVWNRSPIAVLQNGQVVAIDRDDQQQMKLIAELLQLGQIEVRDSTVPRVRLSYWIGPHRLADIPTPLPHEEFPYVPFWGYREDRTGVPYGHIRAMRPMQDEVNARRARMLWQLSARRLMGFKTAVTDKRAVELEVARPDAAIWLDDKMAGGRTIDQLLRVDENSGLNQQQMKAYEDAKLTLQDVANVFKEQLGKAGAADSGIAISQLIEQGTTALASLNENYTFARTAVGNQLYSLVKADIGAKTRKVVIDKGLGQRKSVTLNDPTYDDELGITYRSNDVALTRAKVVLDDVPSSATFRQYQFKQLTDLVRSLPNPQLQAAVLDMVILSTDVPNREEIAKRVRSQLGIETTDPQSMSPEEQQALQEKMDMQELMQKLQETMALLTKERADLENRQLDADIENTEADTELKKVQTQKTAAEAGKTHVEAVKTAQEPPEPTPDDGIPGADAKRVPLRDVA